MLCAQSVDSIRGCPIAKERVIAGANSSYAKHAAMSQEPPPLKVPKELWRLVDFIFKRCGAVVPAVCVPVCRCANLLTSLRAVCLQRDGFSWRVCQWRHAGG